MMPESGDLRYYVLSCEVVEGMVTRWTREAVDGRGRALTRYPPGPARSLGSLIVYGPGRDPLAFFYRPRPGATATSSTCIWPASTLFLVNDPGHVRDILVTHQRNFTQGPRASSARSRCSGKGC